MGRTNTHSAPPVRERSDRTVLFGLPFARLSDDSEDEDATMDETPAVNQPSGSGQEQPTLPAATPVIPDRTISLSNTSQREQQAPGSHQAMSVAAAIPPEFSSHPPASRQLEDRPVGLSLRDFGSASDRPDLIAQITMYREMVAQRDDVLARKDVVISQKESLLSQRDSMLAQRESLLGQKDSLLGQEDSLLAQNKKEVRKLRTGLTSILAECRVVSKSVAKVVNLLQQPRI